MYRLPVERLVAEPDPVTGLPIGPVVDTTPAPPVTAEVLEGRYVRLERLDPARHGDDLLVASMPADADERFQYLFEPAPRDRAEFDKWLLSAAATTDQLFFAVIDAASGRVVGRQSFLRIDRGNRSIEIGNIYWGPEMARTRMATEALYVFARHAFDDLGYRRFEWKCNALNAPSRRAALRFGFQFEGLFRQAVIVRGRSRDTSWYAMIDADWPEIRSRYEAWLSPDNFDADGQQRTALVIDSHG